MNEPRSFLSPASRSPLAGGRFPSRALVAGVWLACCLLPADGRAANTGMWGDAVRHGLLPDPCWFFPLGLVLGAGLEVEDELRSGFLLGVEASAVYWNVGETGVWLGGYFDTLWDFGRDEARLSLGPELGWKSLGFDGGYLLALGEDGEVHHGGAARLVVSLAFVAVYVRYDVLVGAPDVAEVGVLLKYPLGPLD